MRVLAGAHPRGGAVLSLALDHRAGADHDAAHAQRGRAGDQPDPIGSRDVLETYIGGTPDQMPEEYRRASPISYVSARAPRTLLIYGSRDHIVQPRYGRQLRDALVAAGASSELIEIPWGDHAFDALPAGLSGQVALFHTERFLADVFKSR